MGHVAGIETKLICICDLYFGNYVLILKALGGGTIVNYNQGLNNVHSIWPKSVGYNF